MCAPTLVVARNCAPNYEIEKKKYDKTTATKASSPLMHQRQIKQNVNIKMNEKSSEEKNKRVRVCDQHMTKWTNEKKKTRRENAILKSCLMPIRPLKTWNRRNLNLNVFPQFHFIRRFTATQTLKEPLLRPADWLKLHLIHKCDAFPYSI